MSLLLVPLACGLNVSGVDIFRDLTLLAVEIIESVETFLLLVAAEGVEPKKDRNQPKLELISLGLGLEGVCC